WTWMSGSSSLDQAGVYGKRGQSAAANLPGARSATHGWTDASGKFWLFGGIGYDENGSQDRLNDLWTYSPATGEWTWMSGSETNDAHGVYGEKGEAATANVPGARSVPTGWTDTKGNL